MVPECGDVHMSCVHEQRGGAPCGAYAGPGAGWQDGAGCVGAPAGRQALIHRELGRGLYHSRKDSLSIVPVWGQALGAFWVALCPFRMAQPPGTVAHKATLLRLPPPCVPGLLDSMKSKERDF